jgi:hypothetical protein
VEIVTSVVSNTLPTPDIKVTPDTLVNPPPAADDMARFDAAMSGGGAPGENMGSVSAPSAIGLEDVTVTAAAPAGTPGDAILRGLEQLGDKFDNTVDRITQTLESVKPGESLPAAEMLRLQLAMTEVSVHQDLAGKLVGKATQNLDTFLKNQ